MPAFPETAPPEGLNVTATLANGVTLVARFSDGQWWTGLPDNPDDVPIANEHVASWALIE